jgi:hypothetical protein
MYMCISINWVVFAFIVVIVIIILPITSFIRPSSSIATKTVTSARAILLTTALVASTLPLTFRPVVATESYSSNYPPSTSSSTSYRSYHSYSPMEYSWRAHGANNNQLIDKLKGSQLLQQQQPLALSLSRPYQVVHSSFNRLWHS